ncbi:Tripartite tricarboxylate transporter TctA family protein [uncultured archaeon]|nr:Tripartite tricarboxylate transporter TctA family protein [uncultured archaeon]
MFIDPLWLAASLIFGIAAGLLPGLHPNSIGAILTPWLGNWESWPLALVVLLGVRLALQFLPSILVGTPAGQTELGMLPGQRMMREGRGLEALAVCGWSVVLAVALALVLSPLLMPILPALFAAVKPWSGYLLVLASAALMLAEIKDGKESGWLGRWRGPALALFVFLLAAALGWLTLNLPLTDPLFALFVGFFTMPALLSGEEQKAAEKKQQKEGQENPAFVVRELLPFILLGVLLGGLSDLLPGLSTPAQVATLATLAVPLAQPAHFLALVASIEASHTTFAFASAASTGIARVGVVAMVGQMQPITPADLPALWGAFAVAAAVGAGALLWIGRWLMPRWHALDWKTLGGLLGLYLAAMVFWLDGAMGLLVMALASAIGMLPVLWGVKRTQVMGSLIGPAILHAFGF